MFDFATFAIIFQIFGLISTLFRYLWLVLWASLFIIESYLKTLLIISLLSGCVVLTGILFPKTGNFFIRSIFLVLNLTIVFLFNSSSLQKGVFSHIVFYILLRLCWLNCQCVSVSSDRLPTLLRTRPDIFIFLSGFLGLDSPTGISAEMYYEIQTRMATCEIHAFTLLEHQHNPGYASIFNK